MADDPKSIGIIPARKGSKRLPGKNMRPLGGKPLVQWTIEAALASSALDDVLITSDDQDVLGLAESMGVAHRILRPDALSGDAATSVDVVMHALRWCHAKGLRPESICLLQPTSPLRNARHIDEAYALYHGEKPASVISMCALEHPLAWCFAINDDRSIRNIDGSALNRGQLQPGGKHYRLNGAIYIVNTAHLEASGWLMSADAVAYVMPPEQSIDIDTPFDFTVASAMIDQETA